MNIDTRNIFLDIIEHQIQSYPDAEFSQLLFHEILVVVPGWTWAIVADAIGLPGEFSKRCL